MCSAVVTCVHMGLTLLLKALHKCCLKQKNQLDNAQVDYSARQNVLSHDNWSIMYHHMFIIVSIVVFVAI